MSENSKLQPLTAEKLDNFGAEPKDDLIQEIRDELVSSAGLLLGVDRGFKLDDMTGKEIKQAIERAREVIFQTRIQLNNLHVKIQKLKNEPGVHVVNAGECKICDGPTSESWNALCDECDSSLK